MLTQLYGLLERGFPVYASDVDYALRILASDHNANVRDIFLDTIYIAAHKRVITPKSVVQKAYIDAIRNHDIVFGSARPAPARPISRWRWAWRRC